MIYYKYLYVDYIYPFDLSLVKHPLFDHLNNIMIFASSEIIKESERLQEITKIEYESIKADIDSRTNFKEPEPTEIELLQQENQLLKAQNQALQDKADFHEDILTEIILELHS